MTTFGEIVEPCSRTTWEDWDEINTERDITILQWKLPLKVPHNVNTLFVLDGKFLSDCIKVQPKDNLKLVNSIPEVNAHMYEVKSGDQFVFTIKDYNLLQSSEIAELLKPILCKSTDVITIQTKPLMDYQTANGSIHSCIIRQLNTSTLSNKFQNYMYSKLEQPNILSGISAGAICLREHMSLPAIALVYYMEHVEQFQTNEIQILLEKLQIIEKSNAIFNSILTSNLYI
ncbi:unnamed protein product, partial [Brenthis ino]